MPRYLRNNIPIFIIISLTITLFLSHTNQTFNNAISGIISTAFGIRTISIFLNSALDTKDLELKHQQKAIDSKDRQIRQQKKQIQKIKLIVERYGKSVFSRTRKVSRSTISSLPSRTIPILGSAVAVGGALWEVRDACQRRVDIAKLYNEFQLESPPKDDFLDAVCEALEKYLKY